jgi:hypothetical protein
VIKANLGSGEEGERQSVGVEGAFVFGLSGYSHGCQVPLETALTEVCLLFHCAPNRELSRELQIRAFVSDSLHKPD